MSGRTFSVEARPASKRERRDYGDRVVTIHADPLETRAGDGHTRVQMGFPVLTVSGWVGKPEAFAESVAKLLTDAHRSPTPEEQHSKKEGADA